MKEGRKEGRKEDRKEGRKKGRKEGRKEGSVPPPFRHIIFVQGRHPGQNRILS
jgi:hypothetical protein